MNLRSDERKQKVLIIHNYYQITGGEDTVVANEKKLLEDNGHEVLLYTRHNSEINSMGLLNKLLLPLASIYNPRTSREIKKIIKQNGVNIVHVHNTLNLISPSVYYAAVKCGVPVLQIVHNYRFICPNALLYRDGQICEDCVSRGLSCAVKHGCYRGSRAQTLILVISALLHRSTGIYKKINFICLTEFNRQMLLKINGKKQIIQPSKVFVKPNFTFLNNAERLIRDIEKTEKRHFLYAGRLDETKGVKVLFEAWKLMGDVAPRLIVCGSGPLAEWCAAEAKGLNIEIKGYVEREELAELISGSRAVIIPTLLYEGFPMNIVEAYSEGVPVICPDTGNAGNLVDDGVTGWKFSSGSSHSLAQTVAKCVDSQRDMSEAIRRIYNEKYTADANYRCLTYIYNQAESNE